jgi:hypothetical protein
MRGGLASLAVWLAFMIRSTCSSWIEFKVSKWFLGFRIGWALRWDNLLVWPYRVPRLLAVPAWVWHRDGMTCSFARFVGSYDLELVSFRESKVVGVSDIVSLHVCLALLTWSGFHLGNGPWVQTWLLFPARAGHRDALTC